MSDEKRTDADILREMQALERMHAEAAAFDKKQHNDAGGNTVEAAGTFGHCRSCPAPIRWLLTVNGKYMPVDAATAEEDATQFDPTNTGRILRRVRKLGSGGAEPKGSEHEHRHRGSTLRSPLSRTWPHRDTAGRQQDEMSFWLRRGERLIW